MTDEQSITILNSKILQNIELIREMIIEAARKNRGTTPPKTKPAIEEQLDKALEIVEAEIKPKNALVTQLCAALTRISDDTFEIAKIVAPILLTLSLSKSISVPSEPFAVALVAIAIGRMGVAALCSGIGE